MTWLVATIFGVVGVWAAIMFVDSLLRSRQNYTYVRLMDRAGLVLRFGQLRWTTTRYNRTFVWLGSKNPKVLKVWFSAGAFAGILLVLPSILILVITIKNNTAAKSEVAEGQILTTLLPGVNLPMSDMPFYITTLVFCIVVHELGHALAAVGEEARVLGCGLTIVGVLPAAFVDISTEQMQSLSPWRQLKVFCAGIWHNIVFALVAVLILAALPLLLSFGYVVGSGVAIQHIQEGFPSGLAVGDHIAAINDCSIHDINSWYDCLQNLSTTPQMGFCVQESELRKYHWNTSGLTFLTESIECCPRDDQKGVCFAWINPVSERQKIKSFACLPARKLVEESDGSCFSEEECDVGSVCLQPAIENSTRMVEISRPAKQSALYICPLTDLFYLVGVSDFVPKFKLCPVLLPYIIEMLLRYLVSFSGALGILNAIPCYALDGQWIASALVELGLSRALPSRRARDIVTRLLIILGTVLLGLTIVTGIGSIL